MGEAILFLLYNNMSGHMKADGLIRDLTCLGARPGAGNCLKKFYPIWGEILVQSPGQKIALIYIVNIC